eukprot:CAMPEP_0177658254 /NCGR_PEP_ID=MMETSP0447-20121125/16697_1 /TAXON_ID=0 /ORGANISM="Stygamoeba regulata, Strain BSH-02190019" /LENGTH=52 /DNA_ID=CAMNT_0019162817 /DNA_START=13 /DNA_END=169 /DNA_ORIENTATION=+
MAPTAVADSDQRRTGIPQALWTAVNHQDELKRLPELGRGRDGAPPTPRRVGT